MYATKDGRTQPRRNCEHARDIIYIHTYVRGKLGTTVGLTVGRVLTRLLISREGALLRLPEEQNVRRREFKSRCGGQEAIANSEYSSVGEAG